MILRKIKNLNIEVLGTRSSNVVLNLKFSSTETCTLKSYTSKIMDISWIFRIAVIQRWKAIYKQNF